MADDGDASTERSSERGQQRLVRRWLLVEADRWVVTGTLLVLLFFVLAGAGYLYSPSEAAIRGSDSVDTLFQSLLAATITGVTLVLTLNQVVLSQELGAVGDQRNRMEGAMQFREDVADDIEAPVSPSRPAQLVRALVQVAGQRARELQAAIADASSEDLRRDVGSLADSLTANAETVAEGLDDARFGEFDVISSALDFNYAWKIFATHRILGRYREELDEEATGLLERLSETLQLFGTAREHFKTLYFQWELTNLSLRILIASIPALIVSIGMVAFFDASVYTVSIAGVETLVGFLALASTIAIAPFAILLAYVMRIATVTKHTLSIGPFILRETEEVPEVEWRS